jgi:hypothetical protein
MEERVKGRGKGRWKR